MAEGEPDPGPQAPGGLAEDVREVNCSLTFAPKPGSVGEEMLEGRHQ